MELVELYYRLQEFCTLLSICFNSFLIFLVLRHTRAHFGFYKYIIISYAVFEALWSIVLVAGKPTHYMYASMWIIYPGERNFFEKTSFAFLGPSLDCIFFEIWLGFLVLHFVYRYVVTRRDNLAETIRHSNQLKLLIAALIGLYVVLCFFCGLVVCRIQSNNAEYRQRVREEFDFPLSEDGVYTLVSTKHPDGSSCLFGSLVMAFHQLLLLASIAIILICCYKIQQAIRNLKMQSKIRWQKQVFLSLLIQAVFPLVCCHIPAIVHLSLPFYKKNKNFDAVSMGFTLQSNAIKFISPLIVMCCISDYRRAVMSYFSCRKPMTESSF